MKQPRGQDGAAGTILAGSRDNFRSLRERSGYTQQGLSRAAGLSGAYVAQLEAGRLANPGDGARKRLAELLGVSVAEAFAEFHAPRSQEIARRRRRAVRLRGSGRTAGEIAEVIGLSPSRAQVLAGPPLEAARPGTITAAEASRRYGVKLSTLCRCIADGVIPGAERIRRGRKWIYLVDAAQLEAYIAARPQCERPECTKPALVGSRACCGGHASALATAGTPKSSVTRGKMSAAKRGRGRPDMVVRWRDGKWRAVNVVAAADRRAKSGYRPYHGATSRRWKNRANGFRGHRPRAIDADPMYLQKRAKVLDARTRQPEISERALERLSGLSRRQVRAVLSGTD